MSTAVVSGFFVGLVYGLLAIGLVVVYRGSRVINFAHGETGMLAAFLFAEVRFGDTSAIGAEDNGIWLAIVVALFAGAAIGAATELVVVRPLRAAPRIRPLVGTFAVGAVLFTFAIRRYGTNVRSAEPLIEGDGFRLLGLQIQPSQLLVLAVSIVILAGLWAMYRFSAFGLRLRAVALDPYAAGLVGVDVNWTSVATWALAGAIAAISAVLIAPLTTFTVTFIVTLFLRALAATLIGGLTSIFGAFSAGVLLGVAESVITLKSPISGITDVLIAGLVLALMVVRPIGLARVAY